MMRRDLSDYVLAIFGRLIGFGVYGMLLAPAIIVIGASFTKGELLQFPPEGISLRWYAQAWGSPEFKGAMWTSAYLAFLASAIALVLGFTASFVIDRFEFPGKSVFKALLLSPIVIPIVVLGLALLYLMSFLGIGQSLPGLLIGHILVSLPYVVRALLNGLALFNTTLEEAALNLGASPLRAVTKITIPVLMPNLVAGSIFAVVTSFGNITLSIFLSSATTVTLPVRIFSFVESSYDPTVAAVSGCVIVVTLATILLAERLVGMSKVVGK